MNVLEKIESLKGQLAYVISVLNNGGLEQWEAKEYSSLEIGYIEEIKKLELYVLENQEYFS